MCRVNKGLDHVLDGDFCSENYCCAAKCVG